MGISRSLEPIPKMHLTRESRQNTSHYTQSKTSLLMLVSKITLMLTHKQRSCATDQAILWRNKKQNKTKNQNQTKSLSSLLSQWCRQPHGYSWCSHKFYLQMIHLIASSSRPMYLNQHPGEHEATHKKTTNQLKQIYVNFSKPVLGRQTKLSPRNTNHSMLRNQQREPEIKSANAQISYHNSFYPKINI